MSFEIQVPCIIIYTYVYLCVYKPVHISMSLLYEMILLVCQLLDIYLIFDLNFELFHFFPHHRFTLLDPCCFLRSIRFACDTFNGKSHGFPNLTEASSPKQWKWLGKCHSAAFLHPNCVWESGSDCNATLPSTNSTSILLISQIKVYKVPSWSLEPIYIDLIKYKKRFRYGKLTHGVWYWPTRWPTWFHPCHGLSGDSLCHFESQQTFRNAAEGGSRWQRSGFLQPTAGPKKPIPGKDQCCFCLIVQDLVIEDFVCYLGCRFCWYYIVVVVHCYESKAAWA